MLGSQLLSDLEMPPGKIRTLEYFLETHETVQSHALGDIPRLQLVSPFQRFLQKGTLVPTMEACRNGALTLTGGSTEGLDSSQNPLQLQTRSLRQRAID